MRVLLIRKDFKQHSGYVLDGCCLRVLLIRKDFKHGWMASKHRFRLRVLLIRKDFKPEDDRVETSRSLRVLLIRKDFKQPTQKRIKVFITEKAKALAVAASRAFFLFHFLLQWISNHQVRAALFAVQKIIVDFIT